MVAYSVKAYIDLNDDGDFSDANEDISAYFIRASGSRGRSSVNDEYGPSQATIILNNEDGELSPFNASAVRYPDLLPGKAVKIEVVHSAVTYPIFFGSLASIDEQRDPRSINKIALTCTGFFDSWRFGTKRIELLENWRVDDLLGFWLDEIEIWGAPFPVSLRDFDEAYETIAQFWQHRAKPIDIGRTIALQELDGHLFEGKDGSVIFRNRWWRASQAVAFDIGPSGDVQGQTLSIGLKRSDMVDLVEFTRAGLDVDGSVTVLYTLSPVGREFQPGNNPAINTLNGQYTVGGKNVVEPVAVTDFSFNSAADGSGADVTAQVVVDSFTSYGGGFSCTFEVLDSTPVYIRFFQVRGQAVRRSNDERKISVEAPSPLITEQSLRVAFDWNDNADNIAAMARLKASILSRPYPKPPVMVIAGNDAQFVHCLGADIGTRVSLDDTTGPQASGISDEFFIEHIAWEFVKGQLPRFTFQLWQADAASGNLFRVSPDAGLADAYGLIAADAATEFDRIGV